MTKYFVCRDCRWRTGRVSSVGVECMQPENQKRWNEREEARRRANIHFVKVVARYKMPSTRACKKFERRRKDDHDSVGPNGNSHCDPERTD